MQYFCLNEWGLILAAKLQCWRIVGKLLNFAGECSDFCQNFKILRAVDDFDYLFKDSNVFGIFSDIFRGDIIGVKP